MMPATRLRTLRSVMALVWLLAGTVQAAPVVYVTNIPPFVYQADGAWRGVVHDLLSEAASRTGGNWPILPLPFKRAKVTMEGERQAFSTLWRQPEVENSYDWIYPLLAEQMMLVTRHDATFDISSVAAARDLTVGVVLGSPAETIARRLGFKRIAVAASAESNARKLSLGRIDAWIAFRSVIEYGEVSIQGDMGKLRYGAMIEPVSLYLGCSRNCDQDAARRWRAAFESMKKDGSYARILHRYRNDLAHGH